MDDFQMDPARVELFFAGLLGPDDITEDELEWLEDAVQQAVINRIKQPVH